LLHVIAEVAKRPLRGCSKRFEQGGKSAHFRQWAVPVRGRRSSAGPAVPRLAGTILFVVPPNKSARTSRLSCGRGHARVSARAVICSRQLWASACQRPRRPCSPTRAAPLERHLQFLLTIFPIGRRYRGRASTRRQQELAHPARRPRLLRPPTPRCSFSRRPKAISRYRHGTPQPSSPHLP